MSKFVSAKNFFKGFSKAFEGPQHGGKVATIGAVKPSVNKSKLKKAIDDVRLTALKARGQMKKKNQDLDGAIRKVQTKIGQTSQRLKGEPVTKSGFSKGKDKKIIEKKASGGRIGRKFGTPKPKTSVEKIKETFAPKKNLSPKQMKIAKLAGNPNKIDAADLKKLRNR